MKKSTLWSNALAIAVIGVAAANAQAQRGPAEPQMRGDGPPPEAKPFSITRTDPALDQIISPDAKLVELARGFGLTEAGLWIADGRSGYWIFAGLLDNVLYKVTPQKQVSVFMEKAGYTGNDPDHVGTQTRAGRSHVLLIGPSCTGMDHQGRVIWCADNDRQVMRLEKDGTHTVLSSGMNGQKFSGPNDIAIAADDAVYVADNDFGLRDAGKNPDKQLQNGIYRIKDGKTTLVLSGADLGGTPNGIALSPDGKWMYLSTVRPQDAAICRQSRRHARRIYGLYRRRRHRRRPEDRQGGQCLLERRRRPRDHPHHVARGQAARHHQSADLRRRAEEADLCDERGVRRSGWQDAVHRRLRCRLHDPAQDARHRSGVQRQQVVGSRCGPKERAVKATF